MNGFLLGKFLPFHRGHQFLIDAARRQVEALTVLVCSVQSEPIPGWQRYAWVKNTFPDLDVRHVTDENPQTPEEHPDFWNIWRETIRRNTPEGIGVVFSSEAYGDTLALVLGIRHVCVDPERRQVPVSGTMIRQDPQKYWEFIPEEVRPYYIKRVALLGPESSGKSVLAERLAAHYRTVFVEEYGRTYTERFGTDLTELDFAHIAGGQLYREDEMVKQANRVLFCDTDLLVTQNWSEVYFEGRCQPWILQMNHLRRYELFLLLAPDVPWHDDGVRGYAHTREWQFERLLAELVSRNLPHVVIQGDFADREAQAIRAIDALLS
jgi:HTH-type transcriptional regulator, transcriptional repressor of NAD biosynthesis genes